MMTHTTSHRLEGLEPDNLLAFLAMLGLLRSLELVRPNWKPRVYWDFTESPLCPTLTTYQQTTQEEVCASSIDGLQIFHTALRPFRWQRSKKGERQRRAALITDQKRQLSLARRCVSAGQACAPNTVKHLIWKLRCDLIACSGARRSDEPTHIEPTPLKLPSGNMAFIGALFDLVDQCRSEDISSALFQKWTYSFKGNSLRLSPEEAQRYAYRASDPSPEGAYTELGASALSGLGLLSFPMAEAQKHWRMPAYSGIRREGLISWPIWGDGGGRGTSLYGIEAMLRAINPRDSNKAPIPAEMIATARRYVLDPNQGDYGNISRARVEPLLNI